MIAALLFITAGVLTQNPRSDARPATPASEQLIEAARAQIAVRKLDSAAVLLRIVAEASDHAIPDRVQAWVLLGIVDFYRAGDPAAAAAFRAALVLDPQLEVEALDEYDPALVRILAAERAALAGPAPAPDSAAASPPAAPPPAAVTDPVYDCLARCPEGVVPPYFTSFPHLEIANASVGVYERRLRTHLIFHAVINADGVIERESLIVGGGTARGAEAELRRGLVQARFAPGRAGGARARTRVALRFDFQAEGTSWVRYSYRVVAH